MIRFYRRPVPHGFPHAIAARPNLTPRLVALGAVSLLLLTGSVHSALGAGPDCSAVKFFKTDGTANGQARAKTIGWTSSGVRHGPNLLVVDVLNKYLVELTEDGQVVATIRSLRSLETGKTVKLLEPSLLVPRRQGGFLLLDDAVDEPGRILAVTPDLFVADQMRVEDRMLGSERITGVFQIVELGNGALLFADFEDPNPEADDSEKYWSRFVYLDFDGPHQFFGDRVPFELKEYFVRDLRPMASTGPEDAYVLMFDPEESWIAHVSLAAGTMDRLATLPDDFARAPKLVREPEWLGDKSKTGLQVHRYYELFQQSQMPIALAADDAGRLFLAAKGPMADNQRTPWYLLGLSPATGAEISKVRLPTNAAHIVAPIFGSDRVAVIEKGLIALLGPEIYSTYRQTDSMVVFPEKWLARHSYEKAGSHVLFGCKVPREG